MTASKSILLSLRHALGRIRRRFAIDTYDVFARPVEAADRQFNPDFQAVGRDGKPAGMYQFRWATPADIAACTAQHTELDERERREGIVRLGFGHRAVIVFHGDLAVFTMWVNPRNINVPGGIKRRLGAHQAFIYKAFTSPEHRGRKIYEAGMRFVLAELAAQGKTQLVGYAHVNKAVSRKGLAALQFESMGRFYCVHFPGFHSTYVSRRLRSRFPEALIRSNAMRRSAAEHQLHQATA